jgi:hypothetical protein
MNVVAAHPGVAQRSLLLPRMCCPVVVGIKNHVFLELDGYPPESRSCRVLLSYTLYHTVLAVISAR